MLRYEIWNFQQSGFRFKLYLFESDFSSKKQVSPSLVATGTSVACGLAISRSDTPVRHSSLDGDRRTGAGHQIASAVGPHQATLAPSPTPLHGLQFYLQGQVRFGVRSNFYNSSSAISLSSLRFDRWTGDSQVAAAIFDCHSCHTRSASGAGFSHNDHLSSQVSWIVRRMWMS